MTLDLSAITDALLGLVNTSWQSAPIWQELDAAEAARGSPLSPVPAFWPTFTGLAPDVLPKESGPQLSLFLYHVEADPAREALFWQPQMFSIGAAPGAPVQFLPTALDLYYLMSAYSTGDYRREQMLMSVAVRVFHDTPILKGTTASTQWELTLTMEHRSYDEMSRLWQATTSPLRLSVVYRAAVVFLDADPMPQANKSTTDFNVIVGNAAGQLPPAVAGTTASPPSTPPRPQPFGTFREGTYIGPNGETVSFTQSPASVAPGQQVWLVGSNLGTTGIFLVSETGAVTDVSGWVVTADSTTSRVVLAVPSVSGSPPGTPPAPGRYQVQVGSSLNPLSIAPRVDAGPNPVLTGRSFTLSGEGFDATELEIAVGAVPVAGSDVTVSPGGTSLSFTYTPVLPPGALLAVSVRVAGIEADPAVWVST
jgi:hypothetical protein